LSAPSAVEALRQRQASAIGLARIDFTALEGLDPPPRRWVWHEHVPAGNVTMFSARGGRGKTLLAQQLATAVVLGDPFLGAATTKGPVLALLAEDDHDEIWRRQAAVNERLGIAMRDLADLHILPRAGEDNLLATCRPGEPVEATALLAAMDDAARQLRPSLIVVDNVAQVFGGNENARPDVVQFVAMLQGLAMTSGAGVLLIGHTPKNGAEFSGSTSWEAAVRSRLFLDRSDDEGDSTLILTRGKSNYAAPTERADGIRLVWERGVLVQVFGGSVPLDPAAQRDDEAHVLDCVRTALGRRQPLSHSPQARTVYLPRFLRANDMSDRPEGRLRAAMERLIDKGALTPNARLFRRPNRKYHEGLALAPDEMRTLIDPDHLPPEYGLDGPSGPDGAEGDDGAPHTAPHSAPQLDQAGSARRELRALSPAPHQPPLGGVWRSTAQGGEEHRPTPLNGAAQRVPS
jgi:hypothetical protein